MKRIIFALLCFVVCGVASAQDVQLKIMCDSERIYFQLVNWTDQVVRVNKNFVIGAEGQVLLNVFDNHGDPVQLSPMIDTPMPTSEDYKTIDPYLSIGRAYDLDFIKQLYRLHKGCYFMQARYFDHLSLRMHAYEKEIISNKVKICIN